MEWGREDSNLRKVSPQEQSGMQPYFLTTCVSGSRNRPRRQEAIDVFIRKEDAWKALEDAVADEPTWAGTLFVAPIELDDRDVSPN
jgi:hypothetical protein